VYFVKLLSKSLAKSRVYRIHFTDKEQKNRNFFQNFFFGKFYEKFFLGEAEKKTLIFQAFSSLERLCSKIIYLFGATI